MVLDRAASVSKSERSDVIAMCISIGVMMPLPLNGHGVGYTCSSLVQDMATPEVHFSIVTPRCSLSLPSIDIVEVLPKWARYAPYSLVKAKAARDLDAKFLGHVSRFSSRRRAAYLWSNPSSNALGEMRRRGLTIFREQFNSHTGSAKKILDEAYRALGAEPAHSISEALIDGERRVLDAVDYVFCPGPNVARSLLENGVDPARLIAASYGWEPARFAARRPALEPSDGLTILFAGSICVRKGAHLLLDYWARSGVKGRLVLAGSIEPTIKDKCAALLSRDDVVVIDYSREIAGLYRAADAFFFPTLEEGSPLVVYEACGAGLPVVTSEMGAGEIVRPGLEGEVIDPYDAEKWIEAIRSMAIDLERRQKMSRAAEKRAESYIWPLVAERRRRQFEEILSR